MAAKVTPPVDPEKVALATSATEVLRPRGGADNLYMAFYRTKKQVSKSPVKAFFRAGSGMKALRKMFEQTGTKRIEDFHTLSLMEVLEGNKYRDVLNHDSEINAKTVAKDFKNLVGSSVTDIQEFKERKSTVGKGKKKHVKLSWMAEKIVSTGEQRILRGMKLLAEEGYVPKALPEGYMGSGTTSPYRYGTKEYDEQREEYYNAHYGFGYGYQGD